MKWNDDNGGNHDDDVDDNKNGNDDDKMKFVNAKKGGRERETKG